MYIMVSSRLVFQIVCCEQFSYKFSVVSFSKLVIIGS